MRDLWCAIRAVYFTRIRGYYRLQPVLDGFRKKVIPNEVDASPKKLNLGSSHRLLPGYVNVDGLAERRPDVVCDVSRLGFARDNEYDLVRASHILEHFALGDLSEVLAEWRRVLKTGGHLVVCVPNHQALAWRGILQPSGYNLDPMTYRNGWINGLFALDLPPELRHKIVFHFESLRGLLEKHGFTRIRRLNYRKEHPFTLGIPDDSCTPLSLNVVAVKR
jgi:predicted SAM-dependent methyltransferase